MRGGGLPGPLAGIALVNVGQGDRLAGRGLDRRGSSATWARS
jgi:hypothetical protein